MSFESEFLSLMPHTITVRPKTGVNSYNEPTFGTAKTYRCLVNEKQHLVRDVREDRRGEEVVAKGMAFVAPAATDGTTTEIKVDDELTLPDGTISPIIVVEKNADDKGLHHLVVRFGTARVAI